MHNLVLFFPLAPFKPPGLYFSIVSRITASAGADFAVRRHRSTAPRCRPPPLLPTQKGRAALYTMSIYLPTNSIEARVEIHQRVTSDLCTRIFPPSLSFSLSSMYSRTDWCAFGCDGSARLLSLHIIQLSSPSMMEQQLVDTRTGWGHNEFTLIPSVRIRAFPKVRTVKFSVTLSLVDVKLVKNMKR